MHNTPTTAIASPPEILAFYTSVMRGEEEDASITNRISAADKLLGQHLAEESVNETLGKLDSLLDELRSAVRDHTVVGNEVSPGGLIAPDTLTDDASRGGYCTPDDLSYDDLSYDDPSHDDPAHDDCGDDDASDD